MFTLSIVSSEASAEQDIFRHGCEGDLRQGFTMVLRGGHHFDSITEHGSFWRLAVLDVHAFQCDFSKIAAECSPAEHVAEASLGGLRRRTK